MFTKTDFLSDLNPKLPLFISNSFFYLNFNHPHAKDCITLLCGVFIYEKKVFTASFRFIFRDHSLILIFLYELTS